MCVTWTSCGQEKFHYLDTAHGTVISVNLIKENVSGVTTWGRVQVCRVSDAASGAKWSIKFESEKGIISSAFCTEKGRFMIPFESTDSGVFNDTIFGSTYGTVQ